MAEEPIMTESTGAEWYVCHTYSGYENKVKVDLEKTIENRGIQDKILEVTIPMEEAIEEREEEDEDGKMILVKKVVQRKMFPGYVLVHMVMDEDTWYVIRNTRGVTGFVGPGSKPVPLSTKELEHMGLIKSTVQCPFAAGDYITVISGPFAGRSDTIREVNAGKHTVTIMVDMFNGETPLELNFSEVKKM